MLLRQLEELKALHGGAKISTNTYTRLADKIFIKLAAKHGEKIETYKVSDVSRSTMTFCSKSGIDIEDE